MTWTIRIKNKRFRLYDFGIKPVDYIEDMPSYGLRFALAPISTFVFVLRSNNSNDLLQRVKL